MPDNLEDDDRHVTRRELGTELRSFRNEMRLLLVGAVVVIRTDVPKEVTVPAAVLLAGKSLWAFATRT